MSRQVFAPRRAAAAVALALGGCVFESPYWAQTFETTTTPVPIQAWTIDPARIVKIECAPASHGGLYPAGSEPIWTLVANIVPSPSASRDPLGAAIHSAGTRMVLPAACWHADAAYTPPKYMTGLRATQPGSANPDYYVFDAAGLECLGRENGRGRSWFSWIAALGGRGCQLNYASSSTPLPYVRIIAHAEGRAGPPGPRAMRAGAPRAAADAPTLAQLTQAHARDGYAGDWGASTQARLRAAYDQAQPEGSQLIGIDCRSASCRAEVSHRDAAARQRFAAALAPAGLGAGDGTRAYAFGGDDGASLRSIYYLVRADDGAR